MRIKGSPLHHGAALGFAIPLLMIAPALFWGNLTEMLVGVRTYLLLPAFFLLLLPGGLLGFLAAQYYAERQSAWRFGIGLFLGGSLAGAIVFWAGGANVPFQQRLIMTIFGGPLLGGFWQWLGCLLGATQGYARRERNGPPFSGESKQPGTD